MNGGGTNGVRDAIDGWKWGRIWLPVSVLSLIHFCSAQPVGRGCGSAPIWLAATFDRQNSERFEAYDLILFQGCHRKQQNILHTEMTRAPARRKTAAFCSAAKLFTLIRSAVNVSCILFRMSSSTHRASITTGIIKKCGLSRSWLIPSARRHPAGLWRYAATVYVNLWIPWAASVCMCCEYSSATQEHVYPGWRSACRVKQHTALHRLSIRLERDCRLCLFNSVFGDHGDVSPGLITTIPPPCVA